MSAYAIELRHHIPLMPIRFVAVFVVGAAIIAAVEWMFYKSMPRSFWFNYQSVELVEPALFGGPLHFRSTLQRKRTVSMKFDDVLYCDPASDGHGMRYYSNYKSSFMNGSPKTYDQPSLWEYHGKVPNSKATCKLRSRIAAQLPYGIEKIQVIETEKPFHLVRK